MTLTIKDAKEVLIQRLGMPIADKLYALGYKTPSGRFLAIRPGQNETRLWYEPPQVPDLRGIRRIDPAKNANLNGPLAPLSAPNTPRVEFEDAEALHRFLDWYLTAPAQPSHAPPPAGIDQHAFSKAFKRFQELVLRKSGQPFSTFTEGPAAEWEDYKPRLREHALLRLQASEWAEDQIGSGRILKNVVAAIEIQDSRNNLTNNLVFWQNRYGHANRDHSAFLEAASNPGRLREAESLLFGLFRGNADEKWTFEQLKAFTGGKYPLLAYLYFLKDINRFMPIQPTGMDRAFLALGINFSTLRKCNWENYNAYNKTLAGLLPLIRASTGLKTITLIDAHSFCWIFASLLKLDADTSAAKAQQNKEDGRAPDGRQASIVEMRKAVENTVRNANGQTVEKVVKNKELRMSPAELEKHIASLLDLQGNRCALTGLTLQFHSEQDTKDLLPSLDRIDSGGHYEAGNLQVVCQFVNFWKSDRNNEEFKQLLMLVRGVPDSPAEGLLPT